MNADIQSHFYTFAHNNEHRGRLLIQCSDRPGIVAKVSHFLADYQANIIESSQYSTDPSGGKFFMRIEFECPDLQQKQIEMKHAFQPIAHSFQMDWALTMVSHLKKTAIFVSQELHCLRELLWLWQQKDLMTDIAIVISNHKDAEPVVTALNIPFVHIPASKENRAEAEKKQIQLLKENNIDVIVLARYMQILTPQFVETFPQQIINIHHSFLPAFIGANPYKRAFERGVKLIGATSHYVTNDLDEGPIIEQDVMRVDHRSTSAHLKKIGGNIERDVLARAVKWHLEDRILAFDNKTIIF